MSLSLETYAKSKKYTDETVVGGGAIKGKNCTIDSITPITGGNRVTFKWTLDSGTVQTDTMDVMDGEDGKGIKRVYINEEDHLIIVYDDDTTSDAGEVIVYSSVDSVNGKTGVVTLDLEDVVTVGDNLTYDSETNTLSANAQSITVDSEMSNSSENPVQNKVITGALADKVDKVQGKGLSENDYTDADKTIVDGVTTALADKADKSSLGTASAKNVAVSGNASATEVVMGNDTRLTDARTPVSHTHTLSEVTDAGTAAALNVAESGNASDNEVVKGDDTRLVPESVTDNSPYILRKSLGNIADIEIDGYSLGWNQLVPNSGSDLSVTIQSGHKYLMRKNGTYTVGQSDGTALTGLTGGTDNVFDLTLSLGNPDIADRIYAKEQAEAGSGIAWIKSYGFFYKDYFINDSGSIQSVSVGSRKVVGFNQWDEEWEVGAYNNTTGAKTTWANSIRCKNYIKVLPNTDYNITIVVSNLLKYDENFDYLGNAGSVNSFTTDENTHYVRFGCKDDYGTTYKNDICINISDPSKNGTYEPYTSTEYPFPNTQLRGLLKLSGDKIYAEGDVWKNGVIQRKYGIVDLGTLNWGIQTGSTRNFFKATLSPTGKGTNTDVLCANYAAGSVAQSGTNDKTIGLAGGGTEIRITDSAYSDVAIFKTAMSGVYAIYPLATPTTETLTFQNPQRAYLDGTEEFTDGLTRDVMLPVGNTSTYRLDKVLPSIEDYVDAVTQPKADITAIATEENGTTASQAYTVGQHFYKDGKFCTVIANIASGGTFTLNTNYTEGDIAEAIEAIKAATARIDIDPSAATIAAYPVGAMYLVTQ